MKKYFLIIIICMIFSSCSRNKVSIYFDPYFAMLYELQDEFLKKSKYEVIEKKSELLNKLSEEKSEYCIFSPYLYGLINNDLDDFKMKKIIWGKNSFNINNTNSIIIDKTDAFQTAALFADLYLQSINLKIGPIIVFYDKKLFDSEKYLKIFKNSLSSKYELLYFEINKKKTVKKVLKEAEILNPVLYLSFASISNHEILNELKDQNVPIISENINFFPDFRKKILFSIETDLFKELTYIQKLEKENVSLKLKIESYIKSGSFLNNDSLQKIFGL